MVLLLDLLAGPHVRFVLLCTVPVGCAARAFGMRVRSEREEWERIEARLAARSEVEFTHGLSPDRSQTHFAGHTADRAGAAVRAPPHRVDPARPPG